MSTCPVPVVVAAAAAAGYYAAENQTDEPLRSPHHSREGRQAEGCGAQPHWGCLMGRTMVVCAACQVCYLFPLTHLSVPHFPQVVIHEGDNMHFAGFAKN